ncbi:MAG: beta-ketoacyl synthase N-terminal-like domain-containing protein [bacterium]|nr:hypothetical protein [Myxococcales bacterium]
MKPSRPVYVIGGAHSPFLGKPRKDFVTHRHPDHGKRHNPGLEDHLAVALRGAFAATGVDPTAVQKAWLSNFLGERFCDQGHMGALLPRVEPGLDGIPIVRVEAACASGAAAITAAIDAIGAGCDVALAVGVEIETNVGGRDGVEHMALAAHYREQRGLDTFLFPHLFARRAKAYKETYGATEEDLARVVAKAYGNARRNPLALNRDAEMDFARAMTVDRHNNHFLDDATLRPHIRLSDCTQFTDGASAVLLASEEGLRRLEIPRERCTEIASYGFTVAALGAETDPTRMHNVARAAAIAYDAAGVTPDDIALAEVHDCFSIAELQMYEALGLCGEGKAPDLLVGGATAIDGRLPVNPGGGLLGFGHPIGATGIKQVVEVWRQMKRRCGDYQIPGTPETAVTANLGGDDRTAVVMVHRDLR